MYRRRPGARQAGFPGGTRPPHWQESPMLADKDRIFTNIYGWQPASLAAARKRGDWEDRQSDESRARCCV